MPTCRKPLATLVTLCLFSTVGTVPAQAQTFGPGNGLINDSARELDRGRWDKGVELVQQAFRSGDITPMNMAAAYNNLCIGLTGQHKFDEAIDACNRALNFQPREWKFYNNRANVYFYLGEFDRALAEYYKAMTFSHGDSILMTNIGITLKHRRVFGSNPGSARDNEKAS